ncbi:hypothetical protein N7650_17965 [Pseudomonas sp. GD04058]|jgi:hypothetical protein|uniref:hypothetical protein n=1 Tax=Pseudomonas sp. GD04058 TaxID=2975429 RepID=UPI00244842AE|nr:hypothetical protein [Pseudomonas sp. GD04058]MDG9884723.1 hypothetical protein [Pseudomonas sp. GD04058]
MTYRHPSSFYPDLTDDRLAKIAEPLLDIRYSTIREMASPFDDTYTQETAVFGRSRNMLIHLCMGGKYDWLSLASPGMDVTFRIGNVPCRFFRDDPELPGKPGFFKRNAVDDLFSPDENDPVMWRFVVERALTEDDEDRVFLIGYNAFQEKISQWAYGSSGPILHSVDSDVPKAKELPPAAVEVREDTVRKDRDAQNE